MEPTKELLERIAEKLKALADPMRLRLLHTLQDGELRVTDLLAVVGTTQANVSKHLAVLRQAGLVATRRDGMSIFYRVHDPMVFAICHTVCDGLERQLEAEQKTFDDARRSTRVAGTR